MSTLTVTPRGKDRTTGGRGDGRKDRKKADRKGGKDAARGVKAVAEIEGKPGRKSGSRGSGRSEGRFEGKPAGKSAKKSDAKAGRTSGTKAKSRKRWLTARTCDRHALYEQSVQEPEAECDLIDQAWREQRGRACRSIREDFCGTAAVCREWVKREEDHTALGVDLDTEVLGWGRARIPEQLTAAQAKRIDLVQSDVRTVRGPKVDSVLAMNFSYYIFQTREELRNYFRAVRRGLKPDGLFLLDAYGGSESFAEMEEDRDFDGFTYTWDQHRFNPITGRAVNYIHFSFPDGTKLRRAFEYTWRLWTLPEIREILAEAGFSDVVVYWEGTDRKSGEGNGKWKVSAEGDAAAAWVAYLVAKP